MHDESTEAGGDAEMVDIAATPSGLTEITRETAAGRSVRATGVRSLRQYREVINAYLYGLELARHDGVSIVELSGAAEFEVGAFQDHIDGLLQAIDSDEAHQLMGKSGAAHACLALEVQRQQFSSERAQQLISLGAQVQALVWTFEHAIDDTSAEVFEAAAEALSTIDSNRVLNELDGLGIDYGEAVGETSSIK